MSDSGITGIFQGDILIKTVIELALQDMRQNSWVIEDVFRSLVENPILNWKYGLKEVTRAKEFILNNNIPVYMRHRVDKQEFPCITISIGSSQEDKSLATLGDLSHIVESYSPDEIGKSIKYIIPPFQPTSYDSTTGIIEAPDSVENIEYVAEGMIAVDPETGQGFFVIEKAGTNGFRIAAGSTLTGTKVAIVPRYALYRARRERAISQETYNIGCHAEGDPSTLIFLHGVVKYALFRYREGLLEHNNFQLSKLSSTDLLKNESFGVENIYSRWITIAGQVEESWIKSPFRVIEGAVLKDSSDTFGTGIKFCAKDVPEELRSESDLWITVDPDDEE